MSFKQPLAEVFGFPVSNNSLEARRHRKYRLCPFGNVVPSCTKDKADEPLGVCSIHHGDDVVVTCPVCFRQNWIIANDAADFIFPRDAKWTSLTEVPIADVNGKSAGKIDMVLVSYDSAGKVVDFGALEVQAVYISGNIRNIFDEFIEKSTEYRQLGTLIQKNIPHPDYLSSSRKRLAPQLLFKGGILNSWNKKICVALNLGFFNTLPQLRTVKRDIADIAWLVYDLRLKRTTNAYQLVKVKTVYTKFEESLEQITKTEPGNVQEFVKVLQNKLNLKIVHSDSDALNHMGSSLQ